MFALQTNQSLCPTCEAEVVFEGDILDGELITCSGCGSDLEVMIKNNDVILELAPEIQEDWGE